MLTVNDPFHGDWVHDLMNMININKLSWDHVISTLETGNVKPLFKSSLHIPPSDVIELLENLLLSILYITVFLPSSCNISAVQNTFADVLLNIKSGVGLIYLHLHNSYEICRHSNYRPMKITRNFGDMRLLTKICVSNWILL